MWIPSYDASSRADLAAPDAARWARLRAVVEGKADLDPVALVALLRTRDLAPLVTGPDDVAVLPNGPLRAELSGLLSTARHSGVPNLEAMAPAIAELLARWQHRGRTALSARMGAELSSLLARIESLPKRPGLWHDVDLWLPADPAQVRPFVRAASVAAERRSRHQEKLPVLEGVIRHHAATSPLQRVSVIAAVHGMDSVGDVLRGLHRLGAAPEDVTVLGKRNSSHTLTLWRLQCEGARVHCAPSFAGLPGVPARTPLPERPPAYSDLVDPPPPGSAPDHPGVVPEGRVPGREADALTLARSALTRELARLEQEPDRRLVLLDAEGDLLDLVGELPEHLAARVRAVVLSKTVRNRVRVDELPITAHEFADQPLKCLLESVLIAASIATEVLGLIGDFARFGVARGETFAIIGYGDVGRPLARLLASSGVRVRVVEQDAQRRALAERDGLAFQGIGAWSVECVEKCGDVLERADYVIPITGATPFDDALLSRLKDGAIVFPASSSTIELAVRDSKLARLEPLDPGQQTPHIQFRGASLPAGAPAHPDKWHRVLCVGDRRILLPRGGATVNLTAGPDPIPPGLIDVTRAATAQAVVDVLAHVGGGTCSTAAEVQLELASAWMAQVRARSQLHSTVRTLLEEAFEELRRRLGGV